jgi:NNP family nitrate/nitrite transporter-like MFS transporter
MNDKPHETIRTALPSLFFMMATVFFVMYGRLIFAPLLVPIRADLGISTGEAARFFLWISIGYTASILFSGYLARHILHRRTIALSAFLLAVGLLVVGTASSLTVVRSGLLVLGFGAGLYPPSGVSTATSLVVDNIRGRAVALHEVGPNAAFVLAPVIASLALRITTWRGVVIGSGVTALLLSLLFFFFSPAGNFRGSPPLLTHVRDLLAKPLLWAVGGFLTLAACSTYGVFSIMPTYLVDEEGLSIEVVGAVIGASRISGVVMVFLSGWLLDRLGTVRLIAGVMLITGLLTASIGIVSGTALLVVVFFQPVVISAFFPAAISSFAYLGPREIRNVGVSLIIPFANLASGGLFPSVMGALGDRGMTGLGFSVFGLIMVSSLFLLPLLRRGVADGEAVA